LLVDIMSPLGLGGMMGKLWTLGYVVGAFCGGSVEGNTRRGRGREEGIGGWRVTLGRASFGVGTLLVFVVRMDVYMYVHIISYYYCTGIKICWSVLGEFLQFLWYI